MPLQTLFSTQPPLPATNTLNSEFASAYALPPKQALAQYAATGCFGHTFYATAEDQLQRVLALCDQCEPEFIAKLALYSRQQAFLKDMPALLCVWLSAWAPELHNKVFFRVIDNMRMLRTYVQILRSGVVGRRSLGTAPKRLVRQWLERQSEEQLFRASVGQSPSLPDLLKMVHPKPASKTREAFYGYLLGRQHDREALPSLVREYEAFLQGESAELPELPFQMLTSMPLSQQDWASIARHASWQTLRMNLNTFARHGVFTDPELAFEVARRLADPAEIAKARVFPYQLMVAYQHCDEAVPTRVRDALQEAMEVAVANVPPFAGRVAVLPDVSGSMSSPLTGMRPGATTAVRCIDVAALVAAAVLRKNPDALVVPFDEKVYTTRIVNARDSVMTNAGRLAKLGGGGTNCSLPLHWMRSQKADLVIFVSDNESWLDRGWLSRGQGPATEVMRQWEQFRKHNPGARLVCLDLQPNQTTQACERADILNIGGFSDRVFDVIAAFAAGELEAGHWVKRIEAS
jgi:60 kDa SS-A/Ro ribonucleoprotein